MLGEGDDWGILVRETYLHRRILIGDISSVCCCFWFTFGRLCPQDFLFYHCIGWKWIYCPSWGIVCLVPLAAIQYVVSFRLWRQQGNRWNTTFPRPMVKTTGVNWGFLTGALYNYAHPYEHSRRFSPEGKGWVFPRTLILGSGPLTIYMHIETSSLHW